MSNTYAAMSAASEAFGRTMAEVSRRMTNALTPVVTELARRFLEMLLVGDERAFLAVVAADPSDDTARLVYADWLDERDRRDDACAQRLAVAMRQVCAAPGEDAPRLRYAEVCDQYGRHERAEFVRVQVAIAQMEESGDPCEIDPHEGHTCCEDPCPVCESVGKYAGLERRQRELLDAGEWQWLHACCPELHRGSTDLAAGVTHWLYPHTWRRGFLDELTLNADAWLEIADAVFWSPKQTVQCPECDGQGTFCGVCDNSGTVGHPLAGGFMNCPNRYNDDGQLMPTCQQDDGCATCDGTGRVPRPFVPTAHPITRVTLTTLPYSESREDDDPNEDAVRLRGRETWHRWRDLRAGAHPETPLGLMASVLKAEWPGVEFQLGRPVDSPPVLSNQRVTMWPFPRGGR